MNTYRWRRRFSLVVYVLCVLMGLPPGMLVQAAAATRRTGTFGRVGPLETLRNPQFSSAAANRFLFTHRPTDLVGGGGSSFATPAMAGYGRFGEPETLWLGYEGRLEWGARDLMLPGVGLNLSFERMWRGSVTTFDGSLGLRWEFNWNKRLFEEADSDVVVYDMGRTETYDESSGSYTSPVGRYDSLARDTTPNPDELERTDQRGIKETYEYDTHSAGPVTWYRLKEIRDLNDNTLTFAYDSNRNLTKVTDTLARDTTLSYDSNERITKITDSASREWIYGYDGSARLTSVRTPTVDEDGSDDDYTSGKTTTYKYDSSNNLTEVLRPSDSSTGTWKWSYNGDVVTKHTKNGNDVTLTYDGTNKRVTVSDREGINTRYDYDDSTKLISKRRVYYGALDSLTEFWETTWTYNADAEVTEVVFPKGNRIVYTYSSGNPVTVDFKKDGSDSSPVRWVYTYASNARVSTLKDPNGNTWDFDYDSKGNLTRKAAPSITVPGDIETTDNNGNSVYDGTIVETWAYNGSGLVTRYTDAVGTDWDTTYTTVNSKAAYPQYQIADAGGLNLTTTYAYDSKGNVTSVTDPESHATTYTVNALNQVIRAIEPGSVTRKWHYDPNDRVTKTEASNDTTAGNSWYVVDHDFDPADNLTRTRADLDASTRITTTYAYDKNDRLTKITSPEGNDTEYRYDQRDLRTSSIRRAASSGDDAITIMVYDTNGNQNRVTHPRGTSFFTVYDLDGYDRVTKVTQPAGNYVEYAHDKNGNVTSQIWKNAGTTKLAETTTLIDEANRVYQIDRWAKKADLSTSLGDGTQSKIVWRDERGAVLEHSGDVCGCANFTHTYDAVGRNVTTSDPMTDSNLVITAYDKDGNVTKTTLHDETQDSNIEADKDIVTEYVLDARHRTTTKKEKLTAAPTYASTIYSYGLRDQVTKVVDPEADEVRYEHNEQLWKTKDTAENGASDVITEYTFDDDGNLVTYHAENSTDQETIYAYDKLDRVVTITWPDSDTTIYTYDKASNRISTTDPNTTLTVAAYDLNDRLTSQTITLAGGAIGATSVTFGYDGMNRRTQADTSEGGSYTTSIVWTYNSLSKPQTEKQVINGYNSGAGRTITWDWDVEGQKTGVTYPVSGSVVTYTRDALDRADKITRDGTQVVDYAFNGRRVIRKGMPGSEALYTYDGFGRLTQVHHKDSSSGNTLAKFVYAYDTSHQVTSQDKYFYDDVQNTRITTDTVDEGDQYAYDGAKRLVTVLRGVPTAYIGDSVSSNISNNRYDDKVEYILDQTGNRLTRKIDGSNDKTYAYNTVNEMTSESGVGSAQVYTDNGNYERSGAGAVEHRKYNYTDHHAFWDNGNLGNRVTYTWHYDALGRQVARVKSGSGSGSTDVRMYYDGLDDVEVVEWASSTETQSRRSVYGETIDELLELTDYDPSPDEVHYAHADKLGSIMLMVTSGGAIEESYRYKEYGETTVVDNTFAKLGNLGSNINNWKRYTGRERMIGGSVSDPWYHYRARAYRADAGRFVQRDPLTYSDGSNAYYYVRSDPLNYSDPLGLLSVAAGAGSLGAGGIVPFGSGINAPVEPPPLGDNGPCNHTPTTPGCQGSTITMEHTPDSTGNGYVAVTVCSPIVGTRGGTVCVTEQKYKASGDTSGVSACSGTCCATYTPHGNWGQVGGKCGGFTVTESSP